MLGGRPELWPGYLWRPPATPTGKLTPGHGTELATNLAKHAPAVVIDPPSDAVSALDLRAANLRDWLGLQLRAWDEPEAAARLRCLDDDRIFALRAAQEQTGNSRVDNPVLPTLALRDVTGEDRPPRRATPIPFSWQYKAMHDAFDTVR